MRKIAGTAMALVNVQVVQGVVNIITVEAMGSEVGKWIALHAMVPANAKYATAEVKDR